MTKEEIMEAIENMTVLELSELVKAMEEKFGEALLLRLQLLLLALLLVLLLKRRPSSRLFSPLLATRRSTSSRLSVKLRASA